LRQLGCDAYVLEAGVRSGFGLPGTAETSPEAPPALTAVSPADLKRALEAQACVALDLRDSAAYRKQHISGSRWSIRPRVAADAHGARAVVLVTDDAAIARAAAIDLAEAGVSSVAWLDGGLAAWQKAGYPLAASADTPADSERIDFLFFVHDRHGGNREAMKQYLKWETGLIAQLDAQDRQLFRVGSMA
jgi:rhodanese-related sulfurtransferase